MVKKYPRGINFLKKAFHQFFTTDTIQWFEERGVSLKTERDGRMFPSTNSSETIIQCLMKEANHYGVSIWMNREVKNLHRANDKWGIEFSDTGKLESDFICIASGGYPKSSMFEWIRRPGHAVEDPVPSLFSFNMPHNPITTLMGVAISDAQVKIAGTKLVERGPLLITHWGMSGPVILRLSAWGARLLATRKGDYYFTVIINWLPGYNEDSIREKFRELRIALAAQQIGNRNPFGLPQRLWEYFLQQSGISAGCRWAELTAVAQNKLIKNICAQEHAVKGKTTFKEEFVTAGGVNLLEVDANTMQSRIHPNLFFAGEVLDVDGITGGFNFQHAWTSGFIAAKTIAGLSLEH